MNRGKYQWFALRNGRLMQFAAVQVRHSSLSFFTPPHSLFLQPLGSITESSAKATFVVADCKIAKLATPPNSFEIIPKSGKKTELRTDSDQEMNSWVPRPLPMLPFPASLLFPPPSAEYLTHSLLQLESLHGGDRKPGDGSALKNRLFGVELRMLLSHDKAQGKQGDVPHIIKRLVESLELRGARTEKGLFQAPTNFANMRTAVSLLNNSAQSESLPAIVSLLILVSDIDADLSGFKLADLIGLLKHFIKKLPEPLLTYKLYPHFIGWEPRHGIFMPAAFCFADVSSPHRPVQNGKRCRPS